ncbi:hypothetical protein BTM25_00540 [Actinomadura rubteroloni]|uniref:Uncharacterized protein n=1 Tax=Actinomadura rubteroloni TaxID=1926885 RepID=A0A2P4UKU7_9ACTN|nr:hypothetical protein [Actinomadura rubteroloni]POM25671.1 hypothetical protein BTM25_00540 [Actinomadura rubteroloni]
MRPDGDHEPDDYGLPRVDVVVPDDASALAADVLAYRREERRRRRRERAARLVSPVTRFGVAIPIITLALLAALVSGGLMTAFGPRPTTRPTASLLARNPAAPAGEVNGPLPTGTVEFVTGRTERADLSTLRPGVIGIVPPGCACAGLVAELSGTAREFELRFWLVADTRGRTFARDAVRRELRALAATAHEGSPQLVADPSGVLAGAYAPAAGTAGAGLTAVLVQADGIVADARTLPLSTARPAPDLVGRIKELR